MKVSVYGHLSIIESRADFVLTDEQIVRGDYGARAVFSKCNRISDAGMQVFSRMLGGGVNGASVGGTPFSDLREVAVAQIQLGDGVLTTADDTLGLTHILYVPQLVVQYPTATSVRFAGVIPTAEAVGKTITEEVLRLTNGIVFARIAINPGHAKTSSTALQINHTISFSRA